MFLSAFDSSGNYLWANTYGGATTTSSDQGNAVRIDSNGNLVLVGQLDSAVNFGGGWSLGMAMQTFLSRAFRPLEINPVYRWARRGKGISYGLGSRSAQSVT
jgi:hypothetical protein